MGTPPRDHFPASRYALRSEEIWASRSDEAGPLPAGIEKLGVRWNTVSSLAWPAMSGIDWMPDEPVPIRPTRLPVKSTPSCGHRLVKYTSPQKRSAPLMSTCFGTDRHPVAMTRYRQESSSPREVLRSQRDAASSHAADSSRVENRMSRRRSYRSATNWRYRRISGWVAYFSDHVQSRSRSGSKL